jgi:hypothetical protein
LRWKANSRFSANELGVFQPVLLRAFNGVEMIPGDDVGLSGCSIVALAIIRIGNRVIGDSRRSHREHQT